MALRSDGDDSSALTQAPTPDTITLLLKCHKSTTLLSVLPTKPFSEVKVLLLAALRSRGLNTFPNSLSRLPSNPEDLEFGVLYDKKDASKGWVPLEIKEQEVTGTKGTKKKLGGKNSLLNENPLGAGLTDGSWVAYRLKAPPSEVQLDQEVQEKSTPEADIEEDPGWDVLLPTYDEDEVE